MIKATPIVLLLLLLFLPFPISTIQFTLAQADRNSNSSSNNSSNGNANGTSQAGAAPEAQPIKTNNNTFLTYQDPDFGIKMQYPSNWTKLQNNLLFHTIAAFQLIHQDIFDFTNTTLAELDLRVYSAPQYETFAKLNISQINTQGLTIIANYKNASTTLGGLPALKIINYYFGDITQKEMQVWTFIPSKHILVELIYIAQPSNYSRYLPIIEKMIDSVEIAP